LSGVAPFLSNCAHIHPSLLWHAATQTDASSPPRGSSAPEISGAAAAAQAAGEPATSRSLLLDSQQLGGGLHKSSFADNQTCSLDPSQGCMQLLPSNTEGVSKNQQQQQQQQQYADDEQLQPPWLLSQNAFPDPSQPQAPPNPPAPPNSAPSSPFLLQGVGIPSGQAYISSTPEHAKHIITQSHYAPAQIPAPPPPPLSPQKRLSPFQSLLPKRQSPGLVQFKPQRAEGNVQFDSDGISDEHEQEVEGTFQASASAFELGGSCIHPRPNYPRKKASLASRCHCPLNTAAFGVFLVPTHRFLSIQGQ